MDDSVCKQQMDDAPRLDSELCAAPVATLGVVADGVVSAETDPLRDGSVLALLLGQDLLHLKTLVGRHLCCCLVSIVE